MWEGEAREALPLLFFIVFGLAEAGPLDLEGPPLPSVQGSPPAPLVGNRTVRGPAHDAMLCDI